MQNVRNILRFLFVGASLSGLILFAGCEVRTIKPENVTTAEFRVEKMHCDGCANTIAKKLKGIRGVAGAEVSFDEKKATVSFDKELVTPERVVEAINKAGYEASPL